MLPIRRKAVWRNCCKTRQEEKMMNMEKEVYGLVDEWLGTVEYRVARSTYVKYEQLARNYILPFFQSMACRELDHSSLEQLLHDNQPERKYRQKTSVRWKPENDFYDFK